MQPFTVHTIKALAALIVGDNSIGIRRSGSEIERFVIGCGSDFRLNSGSRFPTLYSFLWNLNNNENSRSNLIKIIEGAGDPRQFDDSRTSIAVMHHLNRFLIPDGYELIDEEGKARLNTRGSKGLFMYDFFD